MTSPTFLALDARRAPAQGRDLRPVFHALRGESAVAAFVTMLVCAWFLVAAGAILADPASPYTTRAVHVHAFPPVEVVAGAAPGAREPVAVAPEAHLTITVEARRG
jgi:hypothetical protein